MIEIEKVYLAHSSDAYMLLEATPTASCKLASAADKPPELEC